MSSSRLMNRVVVGLVFLAATTSVVLAGAGEVLSHQKVSDTEGGFTGTLDNGDQFGVAVASIEDLDGDGVNDLVVGAAADDDGGSNRGAVWILFLNPDGTVKSHQKISDTEGGFAGTLDDGDEIALGVGSLGDLDGDGVSDLAVGAHKDDDGGSNHGAVWVLFLDGIAPTPEDQLDQVTEDLAEIINDIRGWTFAMIRGGRTTQHSRMRPDSARTIANGLTTSCHFIRFPPRALSEQQDHFPAPGWAMHPISSRASPTLQPLAKA